MRFVGRHEVARRFEGRRVALVGSGPGCLANEPGFVDAHDVVVRVNNFKTGAAQGLRTDVFYSFFGSSIRKTAAELIASGVSLCMCKCPDAKFMESEWHRRNGKTAGVDFRSIYQNRRGWWFCDTFIPPLPDFIAHFEMLGGHVPTTGFAAVLEVLSFKPASLYLTGFDFFTSGVHNVDEPWAKRNTTDPIGHVPERERAWLVANLGRHPIQLDPVLTALTKAN